MSEIGIKRLSEIGIERKMIPEEENNEVCSCNNNNVIKEI